VLLLKNALFNRSCLVNPNVNDFFRQPSAVWENMEEKISPSGKLKGLKIKV
jgi:hypothetical protein